MVELVRGGRTPEALSREFEPTAQSIRQWVRQADLDEGKRTDGLTTEEREELGSAPGVDHERGGSGIFAARVHFDGRVVGVEASAPRGPAAPLTAWPNPSSGAGRFEFRAPSPMAARLEVFDLAGRLVHLRTLHLSAEGPQSAVWDGRGRDGRLNPAGMYFVRVRGPGLDATSRVVRLD